MIHKFQSSIEGIALPEKFTYPFCYTPHPLCIMAAAEVRDYINGQLQWAEELAEGKMFGVLVVRTAAGDIGYLAAHSGNLAHSNKHVFFIPPVFDLLDPEGFFSKEEQQISKINKDIEEILNDSSYICLKERLAEEISLSEQRLKEAKDSLKLAKAERDKRRKASPDEKMLADMIRESRFLKAELKRLECSLKERTGLLHEQIESYEQKINALSEERKTRSYALQRRLFDSFRILNAKGEEHGLYDIFEKYTGGMPPAGAGDCAAPKLLQYAYKHKMHPLAMAEFWWENDATLLRNKTGNGLPDDKFFGKRLSDNGLRRHGYFYPACKSKCEPILSFMMHGLDVEENPLEKTFKSYNTNGGCNELEIIFEDEWIVVINKPAGMLSVPGKNNFDSVYSVLLKRFPNASGPLIVHRLDMDTSGLMIIAKTKETHKYLQNLFAMGRVKKCYVAILDGMINSDEGEISLPLCPDPEDRPRQIVNYEYGKYAITRYKVLERTEKYTKVFFSPLTGRTHQIRVHAAHREGLNTQIKGDRLYGRLSDRLYLHAQSLEFIHPVTNDVIYIEKEADF